MLNLLRTLEVVQHLLTLYAFHKKKLRRELRLRQKLVILLKKRAFSLYSTTFAKNLLTRWQLGDFTFHNLVFLLAKNGYLLGIPFKMLKMEFKFKYTILITTLQTMLVSVF